MKCERCGKNPGEIRYTEYTNGVPQKQLICAQCAEELGFGPTPETSAAGSGSGPADPTPFGAALLVSALPDDTRCPVCGLRALELRHASLLGCPHCYEVYADLLEPTLERLHGETTHRGRRPGAPGGGSAASGGERR